MSMLERARLRLRMLVDRAGVEREMEDELGFHLEMEIEDRVRAGMSPEEARRTALRDFGGVERFKEEGRDARGLRWWDELRQDAGFAARTLSRSPGFALVAILTLGLGTGATTALFSVVEGVLLRPLAFPEPERLVQLWQVGEDGGGMNLSDPNFRDLRERSRSFEALAAYQVGVAPVSVQGEVARTGVATVSEDFFRVTRVLPALGRGFLEEEAASGAPVALVGQGYWRSELGGDPELGRHSLRIGDRLYSVVGVMPAGFDFPGESGVWVPRQPQAVAYRTGHNWRAVGRLRPGVAVEAAERELTGIAQELKRQHGDDTWMVAAEVTPLREEMVGRVRPALLILLGAAGFLLLVACANVVNLLLARAATRRREIAVRQAMGAGRGRLARQFLTESLVLSLAGGAVGVGLAAAGVRALRALDPGHLPRLAEVQLNGTVLVFALGVAFLSAGALGLLTALRAADGDLRETLAEGGRGHAGGARSRRVRSSLTALQVALTLVLLVGAGLLARSFLRLLSTDPGYRTEGAVVMDLLLAYPEDEAGRVRLARLHEELLARIRAVPGVDRAGTVDVFPLGGGSGSNGTFIILSRPDEVTSLEDYQRLMNDPARTGDADFRIASAGYFHAMEIPLVRGRLFDQRDALEAPHAAVISESLAHRRWPGEDPVGKVIQYGNMDGDMRPFTIVGVVGDVRERGLDSEPRPVFYGNAAQRTASLGGGLSVVATGPAQPERLAAAMRGAVRELAPEVPVRIRTLEEVFAGSLAERRFSLLLLGVFAATAMVLAITGIYGVISYLVAQRKREFGIRLALGARGGDVVRLIVGQGLALALAGVLLGLLVAFVSTRVLASQLYGISATDLVTFLGVPLVLLLVAVLASYLPALRATRVDPVIAMRAE